MNLHVVHIIGGGEFGGAEDHIVHLLGQLKDQDVSCEVICFYDSLFAQMLREKEIPVQILNYGRFDLRLLFRLVTLLKEKKPDIIHTHGVKANFFTRIAARKLENPLLITTVHSLLKYDYSHPIAYRLALLLEMSTRAKNNYYIAISNVIKEQLLSENVRESDIQVIHHGIDTSIFTPQSDSVSEQLAFEWGKRDGVFLIGAVGRMQPVKGFKYFIEACAIIEQQMPGSFRFLIIGEGPERTNLEKLVSEYQLEDVIYFVGFRKDVANCLRALDGYVNSSLSEGLGLAVMEALATGVPVVTTNVGGIKDFARHGENCLVVEPANSEQIAQALLKLCTDKELATKLSKQGVKDMHTSFSQEQMAKKTAFYYRQWLKDNML